VAKVALTKLNYVYILLFMRRPDLPAKEAVQLCLNFNVRKVARVITQQYNTALQPSGLLSTQFSVLVALSFGGAMTISELADILVTDRTTLARNLNPLARKNYLTIARGEGDKRRKYVSITPQGEQVLEKALPLWAQAQEKIKAELGEESWTQMQVDMTNLVALLQR
jgi:DNA-binding MarR family transcriptional regulator